MFAFLVIVYIHVRNNIDTWMMCNPRIFKLTFWVNKFVRNVHDDADRLSWTTYIFVAVHNLDFIQFVFVISILSPEMKLH